MLMSKDITEFMLEEYKQIVITFSETQKQIIELFKVYLAVVGVPITVLAASLKIVAGPGSVGGNDVITLENLPSIVVAVLAGVAVMGLMVAMMLISRRMQLVAYARTVNSIRRYFAELDEEVGSKRLRVIKYLELSTSDAHPPFIEVMGIKRTNFSRFVASSHTTKYDLQVRT